MYTRELATSCAETLGGYSIREHGHALVRLPHILPGCRWLNEPLCSNADHLMDVTPQGIFKRVVLDGEGHGSFCYGMNGLLLEALRGLGFR